MTTGDVIKDIEVSGPGFLNVTITDRAITETLAARYADDTDRLGVPSPPTPARRSSTTPSRTWRRRCT